jgi:hypothetical protein
MLLGLLGHKQPWEFSDAGQRGSCLLRRGLWYREPRRTPQWGRNTTSRRDGMLDQLIFRQGSGVTPDSGNTVLRSLLGRNHRQLPGSEGLTRRCPPAPNHFLGGRVQDERPPGNRHGLFVSNNNSSRGKPRSQKRDLGHPLTGGTWHSQGLGPQNYTSAKTWQIDISSDQRNRQNLPTQGFPLSILA